MLREVRALNRLPKIQISISGAYFYIVKFDVDFFNRIGHRQPFTADRHVLEQEASPAKASQFSNSAGE